MSIKDNTQFWRYAQVLLFYSVLIRGSALLRGLNKISRIDLPEWSSALANYYWHVRVDGRDKAKRRRYYRYIRKEKLRLAELGYSTAVLNALCKHLCKLDIVSSVKFLEAMDSAPKQLSLDLIYKDQKNLTV